MEDLDCSICQSNLSDSNELIAKPNCGQSHYFHISCIEAWSEISTTCPLDRKPFQSLELFKDDDLVKIFETKIIPERIQSVESYIEHLEADLSINCQVCASGEDAHVLLLCDGCDDAYHIYCLYPVLEAVPPAGIDWFCPACAEQRRSSAPKSSTDAETSTSSVRRNGRDRWGRRRRNLEKMRRDLLRSMLQDIQTQNATSSDFYQDHTSLASIIYRHKANRISSLKPQHSSWNKMAVASSSMLHSSVGRTQESTNSLDPEDFGNPSEVSRALMNDYHISKRKAGRAPEEETCSTEPDTLEGSLWQQFEVARNLNNTSKQPKTLKRNKFK